MPASNDQYVGHRRKLCLVAPAVGALLLAPGALAAGPAPDWSVTVDGGRLGAEITQYAVANETNDMVGRFDAVYVAGSTTKPPVVNGVASDTDVFVASVDGITGDSKWATTIDVGGANDRLGGFALNYHNSYAYAAVNSGGDLHVHDITASGGQAEDVWVKTQATANDVALSPTGGFMGVAGRADGTFWVGVLETGGWVVNGEYAGPPGTAMSADASTVGRTLVVTGQESGFGTGGDMHTIAFDISKPSKGLLWSRSWASPNNRPDIGLATDVAYVGAAGRQIAFVGGRTYTPERGFDIVLDAFDLATGAPVWPDGPRIINAAGGDGDDEIVDIRYSDTAGMLYVLATSGRAYPYGDDVALLAVDPLTGATERSTFVGGDASNGDDIARSLTLSKDGRRLYVAAEIRNIDGRHAALFAFDAALRWAGSSVGSGDRAAATVLSRAGDHVYLAGSALGTAGYDAAISALGVGGFTVPAVGTALEVLPDSPNAGDYTDVAAVAARLTEADGAAIAGAPVTVRLGDDTRVVTTDGAGIARATFALTSSPGDYTVTYQYAGASGETTFLASDVSAPFTIRRETTALSLHRAGTNAAPQLVARLSDADDDASAISGRTVRFYGNGTLIAEGTTDADGVATIPLPGPFRNTKTKYAATFPGDALYLGATA